MSVSNFPLLSDTGPAMLPAALSAARGHWEVFPCRESGPKAKAPYTARGHHEATTNLDVITRWWSRHPHALIGATVPRGCIVLDIDPRNGGSLEALVDTLGTLPPTLTCWSGRGDGGRHLYYRVPEEIPVTSTRLPAGVDLKRNGYCILAPSLHPDTGRPYRWEGSQAASLPRTALDALAPHQKPPRPPLRVIQGGSPLVRAVANAPDRKRNDMLFWAACRAGENGMLDALWDDLAAAARSTGLEPAAIRGTLESARNTTSGVSA